MFISKYDPATDTLTYTLHGVKAHAQVGKRAKSGKFSPMLGHANVEAYVPGIGAVKCMANLFVTPEAGCDYWAGTEGAAPAEQPQAPVAVAAQGGRRR